MKKNKQPVHSTDFYKCSLYLTVLLLLIVMVGCVPTVNNFEVKTQMNTPTSISLSAHNKCIFHGVKYSYTDPTHGTITGEVPDLTYTPEDGFIGKDEFTYTAKYKGKFSNTGVVTIIITEKVQEISITLPEEDWDKLRHTAHNSETFFNFCGQGPLDSPYEYVSGTITVDGVTLENVGIRTKGFFGSLNPVRPSLKIKFDKYIKGQKLGDLKRMTLNNNNQDPTRMRTNLAYRAFQKAGYPAPDTHYAHVVVNGKDFGVYSAVEPIKKPFLRKWFEDDEGNLYESQGSDFGTETINSWERKSNEDNAHDRSDIEGVMRALEADDETLLDQLEKVIDLDNFMSFWALEILTSHWDGYSGNVNNIYIYNDPAVNKFTFIPWGTDGAFSPPFPLVNVKGVGPLRANSMLTNRLYNHTEGRQWFARRVAELYDFVWGDGELLKRVHQTKDLLKPYILENINSDFGQQVDDLCEFMESHAANVYESLIVMENPPDYPFEPKLHCGNSIPEPQPFSIEFSTVWGTEPGPGIGAVDVFDVPLLESSGSISVSIGKRENHYPGWRGTVVLSFDGYHESYKKVLGMRVKMSPSKFMSLEPVITDNFATFAVLDMMPDYIDLDKYYSYLEHEEYFYIGVVKSGVLKFDEAGMNPGDTVSGTFSGEILFY